MNRKNLYLTILLLITIILIPKPGNAQGQGANYQFRFESGPIEVNYPNYTGMEFKISFGGFKLKPCDFDTKCIPPPVMFFVQVLWQNPNDLTGDPECWIPVYVGLAAYGPGDGPGGGYIRNIHGIGSIELLNPDHWGDFGCCCCYYPLRCERSYWKVSTWPLVSGIYKVKLYKFNYPEFEVCTWCFDEYLPSKICEWGWPQGAFVAKRGLKVESELSDYGEFMQLYFLSADGQDSVFNGYSLKVMDDYNAVCKIITTRRIEDAPEQLIGYLLPEDALSPIQITFDRFPEEDYQFPCNQNYPVRIYAYKFNESFRPYQLFPDIEPAEWSNLTKYLDCYLYGVDNNMQNNISIRATVMAGLQLDCKNDSTVCFIPAAEEDIEFVFRYAPDMGFDSDTDIRFRIWDSDELGSPSELVYEIPIILRDIDIGPNEWGIPDPQRPDTVRIIWDGRINIGGATEGHLANPHNDPYHARVEVLENDDPILASNTEMFDLVPIIDSMLVTHTPWYPPPPAFFEQDIEIYSLARGRIDDSGNPAEDYIYYYPEGEVFPLQLGFWDGNTHRYWDLSPNVWGVVNYYRYLDHWVPSPVAEWNTTNWGNLVYEWYEVFDYAERREVYGEDRQFLYYQDVNQTQAWGTNWHTTISRYVDWRDRNIFRLPPRMRFGVRSKIFNNRVGYELQNKISAAEGSAHLIILGPGGNPENWDNLDWAVSHIGTPYYFPDSDRRAKKPYTYLDCSGLVISTRIQQIDSENNNWYRINNNAVAHIVQGYYYYPPDSPGDIISLEISEVPTSEMDRGDVIAIRMHRSTNNPNPKYTHVVLVEWIDFDPEDPQGVLHCYGIHARGDREIFFRRVRYDNLLGRYKQWRPGRPPGWNRDYMFLQFSQS